MPIMGCNVGGNPGGALRRAWGTQILLLAKSFKRQSLFRTVKYRPNYPNRPFSSKEEACQWVSSFVDWHNHQHRHSGIKFVTPQQRHSDEAIEICRQRSRVYELARIANPKCWSTSIRCWKLPDLVWINPPADDFIAQTAMFELAP